MVWGALSLLVGILHAAQAEAGKKFKVDGFKVSTYRALISFFMLLPCAFYMEWPSYPEYYLFIIAGAAVSVLAMMAQYNLTTKHCGRVTPLRQPIAISLTFIFWLLIDDKQIEYLQNNPQNTFVILSAFVMFVVSLQFIRKSNHNLSVLLSVLPISILYSIITVVCKIVLTKGSDIIAISLNYVFLSNFMVFLMSLPVMFMLYKRKHIIDKKAVICAVPVSIYHTVSWVFICLAIVMADNPAYPIVVASLAPVWFIIYRKICGVKDSANPVAGAFLALSAILLLLATAV